MHGRCFRSKTLVGKGNEARIHKVGLWTCSSFRLAGIFSSVQNQECGGEMKVEVRGQILKSLLYLATEFRLGLVGKEELWKIFSRGLCLRNLCYLFISPGN